MGIEMIGKQIAAMRKEKGIKQEDLAKYVGVSSQAVSKWENGGVPDTELLPKIADFFSVSVDYLFGRNITHYSDLKTALCKKILETPIEDRFKLAFDYCWDIERSLYGRNGIPQDGTIEDYEREIGADEQHYSSIQSNYGYTRMGIANQRQYFLLIPEISDTETALFKDVDYVEFFKDFSDENVFSACVFLNKRSGDAAFTEQLFVKNLEVDSEQARNIIRILKKYQLLGESKIELNDDVQTVYHFRPTPSFVALLVFAREMIKPPSMFCYYSGGRTKPYFQ